MSNVGQVVALAARMRDEDFFEGVIQGEIDRQTCGRSQSSEEFNLFLDDIEQFGVRITQEMHNAYAMLVSSVMKRFGVYFVSIKRKGVRVDPLEVGTLREPFDPRSFSYSRDHARAGIVTNCLRVLVAINRVLVARTMFNSVCEVISGSEHAFFSRRFSDFSKRGAAIVYSMNPAKCSLRDCKPVLESPPPERSIARIGISIRIAGIDVSMCKCKVFPRFANNSIEPFFVCQTAFRCGYFGFALKPTSGSQ